MRIRTGYSFHVAYGHLDKVAERVRAIGWPQVISDRDSCFGYNRWSKLVDKPIFGVELKVSHERGYPRPAAANWTFLAKNGLQSLNELVGKATDPARKPFPMLDYKEAARAPDCVKLAGEQSLLSDQIMPGEDIYVILSPATPKGLVRYAIKNGYQLVASSENYYDVPESKELYRLALAWRSATQSYPMHILDTDDWLKACAWLADRSVLDAALENRWAIAEKCVAKIEKATILAPEREYTLREMCVVGALRLSVDLDDPVYSARLDRELEMIAKKQFEDYFYIITDIVTWAKEHMIVGPARGSSCGSLVCFLLGITAVDPLKFDLIFERFIDINRADLPDIDLDFDDELRELVFSYITNKYGRERVARLGTVSMLKPRSMLMVAGPGLGIEKWRCDQLSDAILIRSTGDSRALQTFDDTLVQTVAGRQLAAEFPALRTIGPMEGHPQNQGQHAAGIVITEKPVTATLAVDRRTNSVMCDKKDAEDLGMLKIDALGLTQLSIFRRTAQMLGWPEKNGWLEALPLDDPATFAVFNKKHYAGIFQFNGRALQSVARQVDINHINDIVALTALARPGPLATGGATAWIGRKNGSEKITYPDPLVEPYLKDTLGIVVMQEQVMQIGREVGGLTWEDVTALRKAMSRSLGKEHFDRYGDPWKAGAEAKGMPKEVANKFWDDLCSFGSWGFNKCVCGEMQVSLAYSNAKVKPTIAELYDKYIDDPSRWIKERKRMPVMISFDGQSGKPQMAVNIFKNGMKECYELKFGDGSSVVCTKDHRFLINGHWVPCETAKIGDEFGSMKPWKMPYVLGKGKGHAKGKKWRIKNGDRTGVANPTWQGGISALKVTFIVEHKDDPCERCGEKTSRREAHHNDFNSGKTDPADMSWLCVSCHKKVHYDAGRNKLWHHGYQLTSKMLVDVKPVGLKMTYDIEMPEHHNYMLANGLLTHNSHAVCYGIISYWCAWLKAHHPMEFACATLDAEMNHFNQVELLKELVEEDVRYTPIDLAHSELRWSVHEGRLVGPLTLIHGIGTTTAKKIILAREEALEAETQLVLPLGIQKRLTNIRTPVDSLTPIADSIKKVCPVLAERNIVTEPTPIREIRQGMGPRLIIGVITKMAPKDENEAVNVAKRGYKLDGPTQAINMFFRDDDDEIFCKINRFDYPLLCREVLDNARVHSSIFAIKGDVSYGSFRMIWVKNIRHLGEMEMRMR